MTHPSGNAVDDDIKTNVNLYVYMQQLGYVPCFETVCKKLQYFYHVWGQFSSLLAACYICYTLSHEDWNVVCIRQSNSGQCPTYLYCTSE